MSEPVKIILTAETDEAVAKLRDFLNQTNLGLKQLSIGSKSVSEGFASANAAAAAMAAGATEAGTRVAGMSYYFRSAMDGVRLAFAGGGPRAAFYTLDEGLRGLVASGGAAHTALIGVALELAEIVPLVGTVTIGFFALNEILSRPPPLDQFLQKQNNELKEQADWLQLVQQLHAAGAITSQQANRDSSFNTGSTSDLKERDLVMGSKQGAKLTQTGQAFIDISDVLNQLSKGGLDETGKKLDEISKKFQALKNAAEVAGKTLMASGKMSQEAYDSLLKSIEAARDHESNSTVYDANFKNREESQKKAQAAAAQSQSYFAQMVAEENKKLDEELNESAARQAKTREQLYQEEYDKRIDLLTRQLYSGEIDEKQYTEAVLEASTKRIEGTNKEREAVARLHQEQMQVAQQGIREKANAILSDSGTDNSTKAKGLADLENETRLLLLQNSIDLAGARTDKERVNLQKEQNNLVLQYGELMRKQQQLAPTFNQAMRDGITQLRNEWGSLAIQVKNTFMDIYRTMITSISSALTGLIERTKTWSQALSEIGTSILNSIISAIVKMFVTWIINMTILRLLQAVFGKESNQEASQSAAAWGPAAVAASIASYGAAAAVGTAAAIAGMAAGAIAGAALSSYDTGGYTGAGGRLEPAGIVHRGEFVMDADKTQRFRPLLEAMHQGRGLGTGNAGSFGKASEASAPKIAVNLFYDKNEITKHARENPEFHHVMVDIIKRNAHNIAPQR